MFFYCKNSTHGVQATCQVVGKDRVRYLPCTFGNVGSEFYLSNSSCVKNFCMSSNDKTSFQIIIIMILNFQRNISRS